MPYITCINVCARAGFIGWCAHLLCLERVVGGLDGHVLLAVDLDAVGDYGLGLALVGEGRGDGAHLGGGELLLSAMASLCWHPLRFLAAGLGVRARGEAGGRTEKPGDEAQVVWPVASQMTALSMLPVPTRLCGWLEVFDVHCR